MGRKNDRMTRGGGRGKKGKMRAVIQQEGPIKKQIVGRAVQDLEEEVD